MAGMLSVRRGRRAPSRGCRRRAGRGGGRRAVARWSRGVRGVVAGRPPGGRERGAERGAERVRARPGGPGARVARGSADASSAPGPRPPGAPVRALPEAAAARPEDGVRAAWRGCSPSVAAVSARFRACPWRVAVRPAVRSRPVVSEGLPWVLRGSAHCLGTSGLGDTAASFPAGGGPVREAGDASRTVRRDRRGRGRRARPREGRRRGPEGRRGGGRRVFGRRRRGAGATAGAGPAFEGNAWEAKGARGGGTRGRARGRVRRGPRRGAREGPLNEPGGNGVSRAAVEPSRGFGMPREWLKIAVRSSRRRSIPGRSADAPGSARRRSVRGVGKWPDPEAEHPAYLW